MADITPKADEGVLRIMNGVEAGRRANGRVRSVIKHLVMVAIAATLTMTSGSGDAAAARRHAAMAIDANTGEVLYAQAADEPRFPASLTKMMTLYIAFGEIEAGRLSYDTRVRISDAAASVQPSKLDLEPGSEITLLDAMKALVTKSANDVAVAVAEQISGSEAAFARLMTERARQIGMTSTIFRNAHGLPDPDQLTTARDMLTLALRLHDDYPKHYRLFSLRSFTYAGDTHRNHNSLLFHFAGTEGIKTGYTRASGFNLVNSVKRDGKHVVAAVFGGATAGTRNAQMRTILTRALQKAATVKTRKPAPLLIARPKPAPRPQPAVALKAVPRPAERPVKALAAGSITPPSRSHPSQEQASPAQAVQHPDRAPSAPNAPTASPRVEIATVKVRAVSVPTVAHDRRAPEDLQRPTFAAMAPKLDFNTPTTPSAPARESAPAPTSPPGAAETILSKSPVLGLSVRTPGSLDQQLAVLTSNDGTSNRIEPAAGADVKPARRDDAFSPAATPVNSGPGAPPSTLAAQAARLALQRAEASPAALAVPQRLGGPQQPDTHSDIEHEIEIGSFASAIDAEDRMARLKTQLNVLAGRTALAIPVEEQGRTVYKARFAGFDAGSAGRACLELRRASVDCFVASQR